MKLLQKNYQVNCNYMK